ncbi:hypothetical protein [Vibrio diabolicus]|uniref:hypothetical protein n=1 Tax=Vibrio diabolicus TaxID=50719 RepID=UPI0011B091CB|nr:hypothetical protein [Vibrio diabolicus]
MESLLKDLNYFSKDNNTDESIDKFLNLLKAYVNLLFAYAIFLMIKKKDSSRIKSVIDVKILEFKTLLSPIYQNILLPYKKNLNLHIGRCEYKHDFDNSLYIEHYTNSSYETEKIDFLIDFDDRFLSIGHLLKEAKKYNYSFGVKNSSNGYDYKRDHRKEIVYAIYDAFVDISKLEQFIHEFELLNLDDKELKDCIFSRLT